MGSPGSDSWLERFLSSFSRAGLSRGEVKVDELAGDARERGEVSPALKLANGESSSAMERRLCREEVERASCSEVDEPEADASDELEKDLANARSPPGFWERACWLAGGDGSGGDDVGEAGWMELLSLLDGDAVVFFWCCWR